VRISSELRWNRAYLQIIMEKSCGSLKSWRDRGKVRLQLKGDSNVHW